MQANRGLLTSLEQKEACKPVFVKGVLHRFAALPLTKTERQAKRQSREVSGSMAASQSSLALQKDKTYICDSISPPDILSAVFRVFSYPFFPNVNLRCRTQRSV